MAPTGAFTPNKSARLSPRWCVTILGTKFNRESYTFGEGSPPWPSDRKIDHIYVSFGLRPPFFTLYRLYYLHIFVYPFFSSVSGPGSVFIAEERRQCIAVVYDDILRGALLVERAPKHYGIVRNFRRSTSPKRLVGVVGEFPDTCVATVLMHSLRRNFPLIKASRRLEREDRGHGAERKSVQDERENLPPNSDTFESEPEHRRLFERPRDVLMHRAGETITDGRRRAAALYGMIHNWPYAARKRTGDSQSGWRPPPDKNI